MTAAALVAIALAAPATAGDPYRLEFAPLPGGLVLAYRPDMARFPVVGNAVIIPTGMGVVLVDGGGGASVADQIVARIRELRSGPLVAVILTHWHADHTVGIDRYIEAFPAARVVSHPWTHDRMVKDLLPRLSGTLGRFLETEKSLREQLASGIDSETGKPLGEIQVARAKQILEDSAAIEAQKARAGSVEPVITTDGGGLDLHLGKRLIEVRDLGVGNTPGDLVIYLPNEKVLMGGDILTYPVPFGYPRSPTAVLDATEKLLAFDFDVLVPGHGEVQHDREYGRKVLALDRRAIAEIRRLHEQGLDEAAIHERLDLGEEQRAITHGDPELEHLLDIWYLQPIVGRLLAELSP